MIVRLTPEDVAHRLDLDGELVGVEWDDSAHEVRFVVETTE